MAADHRAGDILGRRWHRFAHGAAPHAPALLPHPSPPALLPHPPAADCNERLSGWLGGGSPPKNGLRLDGRAGKSKVRGGEQDGSEPSQKSLKLSPDKAVAAAHTQPPALVVLHNGTQRSLSKRFSRWEAPLAPENDRARGLNEICVVIERSLKDGVCKEEADRISFVFDPEKDRVTIPRPPPQTGPPRGVFDRAELAAFQHDDRIPEEEEERAKAPEESPVRKEKSPKYTLRLTDREEGSGSRRDHTDRDEGSRSRRDHTDRDEGSGSRRDHADRHEGSRSRRDHTDREEGSRSRRDHTDREEGSRSRRDHTDRDEYSRSRRDHTDRDEGSRSRRDHTDREGDSRSRRDHTDREGDSRSRRDYTDRENRERTRENSWGRDRRGREAGRSSWSRAGWSDDGWIREGWSRERAGAGDWEQRFPDTFDRRREERAAYHYEPPRSRPTWRQSLPVPSSTRGGHHYPSFLKHDDRGAMAEPRPSFPGNKRSRGPDDGPWLHDKFHEVNDSPPPNPARP